MYMHACINVKRVICQTRRGFAGLSINTPKSNQRFIPNLPIKLTIRWATHAEKPRQPHKHYRTVLVTAMRFAAVSAACIKDRSGVRAVEEATKSVIGPVYDKFHLVPDEILRIDDRHPHILAPVHRPPSPSRTTATGIVGAVYARCEPVAKELYERYEAKAEQCAAEVRQRLLPRVPKAACWTEKYGEKVAAAAEKGGRVSALVSTERIAKMFGA